MHANFRSDIKSKPHSASFTSLQMNESFNHFRSVSYFEAVANASLSGSRKSFDNYTGIGRPKQNRITSNSTPCTPKRIEIEKYSTLPVTQFNNSVLSNKKTRSSSLSSFFRKLRPKFHRSSSDGKNPWIVIEFSPHNNDDVSSEDSDKSDNSLEMAAKSKVQHFTSLKDLYENSNNDLCNCALSNKRKDSSLSPKCNFNSISASKTSDSFSFRNQKCPSKYKSESSILFKLSPRRRFENLKHMLKRLSNYSRYKNSTSLPSLSAKCHVYKSDSCLKNNSVTSNAFSPGQVLEDIACILHGMNCIILELVLVLLLLFFSFSLQRDV